MKKVLGLVVATSILATASFVSAKTIVGSKHDLSSSGIATASGTGTSQQICIYCHAPHNAALSLPLWNRNNPQGSTFTLYSGLNMANVSFKSGFTSDSTSLFCMSCHDGATNISAVHNAGAIAGSGSVVDATDNVGIHTAAAGTFASGTIATTNPAGIGGKNLSKTHPINFPVLSNSQNDLNFTPGQTLMGPAVFKANLTKTFPLFKATADAGMSSSRSTINSSLECGSCHAVHNAEFSPFLRDTMDDSQLCLGCHNK